MEDNFSETTKSAIKDFDKNHVIKNIILVGFDGAIRNIELGFEFDETYTEDLE